MVIKQKVLISVQINGKSWQNTHGNHGESQFYLSSPASWIDFSIFYYATVSLSDSVVVFGGWNGRSDLSTVAEFSASSGAWSKLGDLQQPRHGHSAITNGKTVLVIGGSGKL